MVVGCFSLSDIGPILQITGKIDRFHYKTSLGKSMLLFTGENMPFTWIY